LHVLQNLDVAAQQKNAPSLQALRRGGTLSDFDLRQHESIEHQ
jgi:hypothetical protein